MKKKKILHILGTNHVLEACYPEIYKIVYPMICKACLFINEEITEELVERITNEIYENLEQEETPEEKRSAQVKVNYSNIPNNRNIRYANQRIRTESIKEENCIETRQRNFLLNDLIKILVLRELIGMRKKTTKTTTSSKTAYATKTRNKTTNILKIAPKGPDPFGAIILITKNFSMIREVFCIIKS